MFYYYKQEINIDFVRYSMGSQYEDFETDISSKKNEFQPLHMHSK